MKWFKSGCIDFTKPDKPIIVEPTNAREIFDAKLDETMIKVKKDLVKQPSWADLPMYSNIRFSTNCANLTIR
jgi:hypothetical protein